MLPDLSAATGTLTGVLRDTIEKEGQFTTSRQSVAQSDGVNDVRASGPDVPSTSQKDLNQHYGVRSNSPTKTAEAGQSGQRPVPALPSVNIKSCDQAPRRQPKLVGFRFHQSGPGDIIREQPGVCRSTALVEGEGGDRGRWIPARAKGRGWSWT